MHQKDIITSYPKTYNYGISPMRSDGNPAVKIEGRGGQQRKDREFPSNFDVVPKDCVNMKMRWFFLIAFSPSR